MRRLRGHSHKAVEHEHPQPVAWRTNDLDPRWPADTHHDARSPLAWAQPVDFTVDNPPFSKALEIAEQAIEHSRVGVALHLRASIHEVLKTGVRRTWMADHPPTGILWLPRFAYQRSPTTGDWTTDSVGACWVIWMFQSAAEPFIGYAPEWVLDDLDAETSAFRARMDVLMGVGGKLPAHGVQGPAVQPGGEAAGLVE